MEQQSVDTGIPESIERFFWDCDPSTISLSTHKEFIIRRILENGDWDSVTWMRRAFGDNAIQEWLESGKGRGLSPRLLRFWQVVLDLSDEVVDDWISLSLASTWENRTIDSSH